MTYALSPGYDVAYNLSVNMPPQPTRRTSRSSGSQSGCRSSRIEKPRSNHASPRIMERRKTTTGSKRYATLDDHYNMMFGITGQEEDTSERKPMSRPMSWHPSSTQFQVPPRSSVMTEQQPDWSQQHPASSRNSANASDFYSLSTRDSMLSEHMQSFQAHNAHDVHRGSQDSESSWQTPGYTMSSYSTPATEPMPWYLQEWARKNQAQAMDSHNASTDFLPIQHPAAEEPNTAEDEEMEEDSGKELVGMGLYDPPDSALSWSSGLVERTGKGLKLEETWQPPADNNEDEDEDGEADDASSDDGSVEDFPAPPQAPQPTFTAQTGVTKPQKVGNMDGQSFFFDEDESYTKEWWFHQLKQPTMPVRDAGLGYGWL